MTSRGLEMRLCQRCGAATPPAVTRCGACGFTSFADWGEPDAAPVAVTDPVAAEPSRRTWRTPTRLEWFGLLCLALPWLLELLARVLLLLVSPEARGLAALLGAMTAVLAAMTGQALRWPGTLLGLALLGWAWRQAKTNPPRVKVANSAAAA